jgi:hypothetical protein
MTVGISVARYDRAQGLVGDSGSTSKMVEREDCWELRARNDYAFNLINSIVQHPKVVTLSSAAVEVTLRGPHVDYFDPPRAAAGVFDQRLTKAEEDGRVLLPGLGFS